METLDISIELPSSEGCCSALGFSPALDVLGVSSAALEISVAEEVVLVAVLLAPGFMLDRLG